MGERVRLRVAEAVLRVQLRPDADAVRVPVPAAVGLGEHDRVSLQERGLADMDTLLRLREAEGERGLGVAEGEGVMGLRLDDGDVGVRERLGGVAVAVAGTVSDGVGDRVRVRETVGLRDGGVGVGALGLGVDGLGLAEAVGLRDAGLAVGLGLRLGDRERGLAVGVRSRVAEVPVWVCEAPDGVGVREGLQDREGLREREAVGLGVPGAEAVGEGAVRERLRLRPAVPVVEAEARPEGVAVGVWVGVAVGECGDSVPEEEPEGLEVRVEGVAVAVGEWRVREGVGL